MTMFSTSSTSSSAALQRFSRRGSRGLTVATLSKSRSGSISTQNDDISPSTRSSGSGSSHRRFPRFRGSHKRDSNNNKTRHSPPLPRQVVEVELPLSPPAELKLKLMPLIAEYRSKNYITAQEEAEYMRLLELKASGSSSAGGARDPATVVQQALYAAKERHVKAHSSQNNDNSKGSKKVVSNSGNSRSLFRRATASTPTASSSAAAATATFSSRPSNNSDQISIVNKSSTTTTKPQPSEPAIATTTTVRVRGGSDSQKPIIETEEAWHRRVFSNEQELESLFVEMCFFARLGFVQPPMCLKCVYHQVVQKQQRCGDEEEEESCQRWVVWRKNANTLLHPGRLDENLVLVQCGKAARLLEGQPVGQYQWDVHRRQLVYHM